MSPTQQLQEVNNVVIRFSLTRKLRLQGRPASSSVSLDSFAPAEAPSWRGNVHLTLTPRESPHPLGSFAGKVTRGVSCSHEAPWQGRSPTKEEVN